MKNLIYNKIIIYNILIFFMVFLSLFILLIPGWIYNNFGEMDIERILFTITLPLKGTPGSVLFLFIINLLYPVFLYSCILVIIFNAILYIKYFNATVIKQIYGFIFKLLKTCKVKIIKISIIFSICFLLFIQLINFLLPIKYNFNFQLITFIILLLTVSFICYLIIYKLKKIKNYYILILVFFTVVLCLNTVIFLKKYKIYSYISNVLQTSDFYEKYYIDAKKVNITAPKNKRNLILIFLESIEFSYADKRFFPDNLIPELINLSNNNISFKNFCNGYCQHCTQMAIVANMTGLAITGFAPNFNLVSGSLKTYLQGSSSIGEILKNNGYTNLFLQGSNKAFSGADVFLETHDFKNSVFDSSYLKQTYNITSVPG